MIYISKFIIIITISINLNAAYAAGENFTNQILADNCRFFLPEKGITPSNNSESFGSGICIGFLEGWLDSISLIELTLNKKIVCIPSNVIMSQVQKIYLKWAEKNPEKLHQAAAIGLMGALQEAFPCTVRPKTK
jgi:hypothetical protein